MLTRRTTIKRCYEKINEFAEIVSATLRVTEAGGSYIIQHNEYDDENGIEDDTGCKDNIRKKNLRQDAPCQCTYRSQCETHRQYKFARSSTGHHAFRRSSPRYLLTEQSLVGHFYSGCTVSEYFPSGPSHVRAFFFWTQPCQGIFLLDPAMSGYFPTGPSHVRAFSNWTQPCQGIFLLDAAVSGQMPSRRYVS